MAYEGDQQDRLDRQAGARQNIIAGTAGAIAVTPQLAEEINRQLNDAEEAADVASHIPPPPDVAADGGLGAIAGVGRDTAQDVDRMWIPGPPPAYDENLMSERINAIADLYYMFQHERIGIFRIVKKLQELFQAGAVRLSEGDGARRLYQYDRREVLRYTKRDRIVAYRRAFGYGSIGVPSGTTPNVDFHRLFSHFNNQVALFWRDKRISDVIRTGALDPSFGSIAIVRRSGFDLRNNLKFTSFGHINVMRIELMQLLDEAFRILGAQDVRNLFGVDTAWDVVDEVLVRYFNERLTTSPRQRMAVQGRAVLQWLANPYLLTPNRIPFEAQLLQVAEPAEEWLTSAQSLGLAPRLEASRVMPWDPPNVQSNGRGPSRGSYATRYRKPQRRFPKPPSRKVKVRAGRNGSSRRLREYEW
jgi:hypothetical protein